MGSHMIIIEPVKKFCRDNLEFGVDSGDVSGTGIVICIISVIFNLTAFILT